MKNCKKCLVTKSVSDFYKHKGICKDCFKEKNKKYKDENAEHLKEIDKDLRKSLIDIYKNDGIEIDNSYKLVENNTPTKPSRYRDIYGTLGDILKP
jgi:16S rRNA A1518/A1519 N6-dimethyltransferase RsmA/KsgA/DIM1 with predicted DNA glycosylase/AP lyase activity